MVYSIFAGRSMSATRRNRKHEVKTEGEREGRGPPHVSGARIWTTRQQGVPPVLIIIELPRAGSTFSDAPEAAALTVTAAYMM